MTGGMTDDELLAKFEAAALAGSEFHHREHVRVAWLYLRHLPLLVAAARFHGGLVRLAAALGVPRLYHATITWAYLLLIHERMARRSAGESWEEFAAASRKTALCGTFRLARRLAGVRKVVRSGP